MENASKLKRFCRFVRVDVSQRVFDGLERRLNTLVRRVKEWQGEGDGATSERALGMEKNERAYSRFKGAEKYSVYFWRLLLIWKCFRAAGAVKT